MSTGLGQGLDRAREAYMAQLETDHPGYVAVDKGSEFELTPDSRASEWQLADRERRMAVFAVERQVELA